MMGAFALAPMYRGIEQLTGGLPPTDVFLIVGIIHLLPSFVLHRLKVPTIYLMGLLLMAVCSLISVMVTGDLLTNAFYAVQWLFFIGVAADHRRLVASGAEGRPPAAVELSRRPPGQHDLRSSPKEPSTPDGTTG